METNDILQLRRMDALTGKMPASFRNLNFFYQYTLLLWVTISCSVQVLINIISRGKNQWQDTKITHLMYGKLGKVWLSATAIP